MSWSTCYSGSNNIHFNVAPMMSDSRMFTMYNPACNSNTELRNNLNITNNYDYRQWLIKNGTTIRNKNFQSAKNENSECIEAAQHVKTNGKYLFQDCADNSRPFGYETSDLKNLYLTRNALQSRTNPHILTQEQLLLARASKCGVGDSSGAGPMRSCSSNKFQ